MTQVFGADGTATPATRVEAGPCVVVQVKTSESDGISALQLGFGSQKRFRLTRAEQGHVEGLPTPSALREFRVPNAASFSRGDMLTAAMFVPGEKVKISGVSKGKGFQGVVKRHGFAGGPASHGHKDNLRMPGAIGAGGVQRVFKNVRMGGHMGAERVTISNLEVIGIKPEASEILVRGAIPGPRGGLLLISSAEGEMAPARQDNNAVNAPDTTHTS